MEPTASAPLMAMGVVSIRSSSTVYPKACCCWRRKSESTEFPLRMGVGGSIGWGRSSSDALFSSSHWPVRVTVGQLVF